MSENLNKDFDIPLERIEDEIGMKLDGDLNGYKRVVPLRKLVSVNYAIFFKKLCFDSLMRGIPIRGTSIKPYQDSKIEVFDRSPSGAKVGQTFILESKLLSIMSGLSRKLFGEFYSNGLSEMPPLQVYGQDSEGEKALAFYIPPIIEIHNDEAIILDGMHRNYLCNSVGTTIKAVHISRISVGLPFEPINWEDIKLTNEKPPISERYVNLRQSQFRDLEKLGIDG